MNKNIPILLSWALALIIFGSACGGPSLGSLVATIPPPTRTPRPTRTPTITPTPTPLMVHGTVTIWHSWDDTQLPILVQIIDKFREQYSDVQFDVQFVPPDDLLSRFQTEARAGQGPALILGSGKWGPILYDAGLIADIGNLGGEDQLVNLNRAAVGSVQYHDALIGLPYQMDGVVLFRNKGIVPEVAESFDDLISITKSVTKGDIVGAYLERSFFYSGGHLLGIGGQIMDTQGNPAFNDASGITWLKLLKDFEQVGPTDYLTNDDIDRFKTGKVGYIIDGTWNRSVFTQSIGVDNLAIDPWPSYINGSLAGFVQSNNIYLRAGVSGDDQMASWKFMQFMDSPDAQTLLSTIGHIPVLTKLPVQDRLTSEAMAALAKGVTYPVIPQMDSYLTPMDTLLKSVLINGADPAELIKAAEKVVRDAIANSSTAATPAP